MPRKRPDDASKKPPSESPGPGSGDVGERDRGPGPGIVRMGQYHDALFRIVFSDPAHAAEALRALLPPQVAAHFDWNRFEPEHASVVSEGFRQRHGDLQFRAWLIDGREAFVRLLFEHQSNPERFMCRRLLRYVLDTWDHHLKQHDGAKRLPVVIPIVLHHGENGWTEPVSLRELYDAPAEVLDALRPFLPELTFLLDDLAPQSDAALRARALSEVLRMTLWALKHVRQDRDVLPALREALDLLAAMLDAPSGLAALNVLMLYILEVTGTQARDVKVIVDQLGRPEASEIVMTAAEQLREEGREQNQRDYLIRLLSQRFGQLPDPVLARIQRADVALLDRWFDRGITAPSLDVVFAHEP